MTQATVIKKISEDSTKKKAVIDVLRCLNGESYADATDILAIAGHFLSVNYPRLKSRACPYHKSS